VHLTDKEGNIVGPHDLNGNITLDSFIERGVQACQDIFTAGIESKSFTTDELLFVSNSAHQFAFTLINQGGYELSGAPKGNVTSHGAERWKLGRPPNLKEHRQMTLSTIMDSLGSSVRDYHKYNKSTQRFDRLRERYEDYAGGRFRVPYPRKQPNRNSYDKDPESDYSSDEFSQYDY
jgi:hypothetical protein